MTPTIFDLIPPLPYINMWYSQRLDNKTKNLIKKSVFIQVLKSKLAMKVFVHIEVYILDCNIFVFENHFLFSKIIIYRSQALIN